MKIKINLLIFLFLSIFFLSCEKTGDFKEAWSEAQYLYEEKEFDNSIIALNRIIHSKASNDYKAKSLFLTSEIYLNEYKEYSVAIFFLNQLLDNYPNHILSKRSLFTKAYINANYLQSYSDAILLYELFIEKYPEDELISSVYYELDELAKYDEEIKNLLKKN